MTRLLHILGLGFLLSALPTAAGCASSPAAKTAHTVADPAPALTASAGLYSPDEAISFVSWDAFAD